MPKNKAHRLCGTLLKNLYYRVYDPAGKEPLNHILYCTECKTLVTNDEYQTELATDEPLN